MKHFSLCLRVQEMSHVQMTMEKTSLQKCLLYFESLHGRPVRKALIYSSLIKLSSFLKIYMFFRLILQPVTTRFAFLSVYIKITKQERTLMKPFYDRYRLVKQLLLSVSTTTVITTIVSTWNCREKFVPVRWTRAPELLQSVELLPSSGQKYDLHRKIKIYKRQLTIKFKNKIQMTFVSLMV